MNKICRIIKPGSSQKVLEVGSGPGARSEVAAGAEEVIESEAGVNLGSYEIGGIKVRVEL